MRDGKLIVYRMARGENPGSPLGMCSQMKNGMSAYCETRWLVDALELYGLYFGTTSGEIYCSLDRGESWERLPGQLSRILSVKPMILED